jgi:hypothetical protein
MHGRWSKDFVLKNLIISGAHSGALSLVLCVEPQQLLLSQQNQIAPNRFFGATGHKLFPNRQVLRERSEKDAFLAIHIAETPTSFHKFVAGGKSPISALACQERASSPKLQPTVVQQPPHSNSSNTGKTGQKERPNRAHSLERYSPTLSVSVARLWRYQ